LAEGQYDVQRQQDARRGVRHSGYHSDDQQASDGPDCKKLLVESEIHGLRPSSCRRQDRDASPGRLLLCCALQLYLDRVNAFGKHRIPGPVRIQSCHHGLDTGGVETDLEKQHYPELRAGTPARNNRAGGGRRGHTTAGPEFDAPDRGVARRGLRHRFSQFRISGIESAIFVVSASVSRLRFGGGANGVMITWPFAS
jgi:hypothetical protein